MSFWGTVQLIFSIRSGDAFRALRFARQRDRLEQGLAIPSAQETPQGPGTLHQAKSITRGAHFTFANAQLEVLFLGPDLLRLTWQPGELPPPYALDHREWPEASVTLQPGEGGWSLRSDALVLQVRPDGGLLLIDGQGHLLRKDAPPLMQAGSWTLRTELRPEEVILGLGERAAPLNLRPGNYRMWNKDPYGGYGPGADPIYMCLPVYLGLHKDGSYLIFFENPCAATFAFHQWAEAKFARGALRYYMTPGPPTRALERYSELTGRPPLPPRWALGYHQSRWGYRDTTTIRGVAQGFADHQLPITAIHLDLDHMDRRQAFTIDPRRFGDLTALAEELSARGIHLVTIVDPGIRAQRGSELFQDGLEHDAFCKLPNGEIAEAPVWPGMCAFPDFTDPRARSWWGGLYPRLLDKGITGFWHDMNEPAVFTAWGDSTLPLSTRHNLEGHGGDHRQAHNLYGLLMNMAGYESLRELRPTQRPFILSRSGWAGSQRYAWSWTGDTASTWDCLRQTIPTVLNVGLSGIPYSGPDIGGFSGAPNAELFLRWFQLAAFLPFFRTHCFTGAPRREPWCFDEPTLSAARDISRLRCRLLPYLYTLAWQASQTGQPIVRPLGWRHPEELSLWEVQDSFLLGDDLLVAPIVQPGERVRDARLPSGSWYHFWDDRCYQGPCNVQLEAPLSRIPILVRAGSLLPTEEENTLVLHVYCPTEEGQSQTTLFNDAGDGYADWRLDHLQLHRRGHSLELDWRQEGAFPFPYQGIILHLHGAAARVALLDRRELELSDGRVHLLAPFDRLDLEL